jgi:hypothetical protein
MMTELNSDLVGIFTFAKGASGAQWSLDELRVLVAQNSARLPDGQVCALFRGYKKIKTTQAEACATGARLSRALLKYPIVIVMFQDLTRRRLDRAAWRPTLRFHRTLETGASWRQRILPCR